MEDETVKFLGRDFFLVVLFLRLSFFVKTSLITRAIKEVEERAQVESDIANREKVCAGYEQEDV